MKAAGCERVFEETASGARTGRPILTAALDYMRAGDTLVVWRLDRLARSLPQLIDTVGKLKERGIALRSLGEQVDTSTASGELVFHIFGALAQFERGLIGERTKAGLEAARARGRKGGRPRRLSDADIDTARRLLDADVTFSEVARRLKVGPSTLYNYFPSSSRAPRGKGQSSEPELPLASPA